MDPFFLFFYETKHYRFFRMLRPLRIMKKNIEILRIVMSMIAALPNLWAVLVLTIGILIVWSVMGMHLYGDGLMLGRCYYPPSKTFNVPTRHCLRNVTCGSGGGSGGGARGGNVATNNHSLAFAKLCPRVTTESEQYMTSMTLPINMSSGHVILPNCFILNQQDAAVHAAHARQRSFREQKYFRNRGTNNETSSEDLYYYKGNKMLSNNFSEWIQTGELVVSPYLWPLPRFVDKNIEKEMHGVDVDATMKLIENIILQRLKKSINYLNNNYEQESAQVTTQVTTQVTAQEVREKYAWPNRTERIPFVMHDGKDAIKGGWIVEEMCNLGAPSVVRRDECGTRKNGTTTINGVCRKWRNPMKGFGSFDSIYNAILLMFVVINMEGWDDIAVLTSRALENQSLQWTGPIFYISLIMLGSFFAINLAMAVVWDQYAAADEDRRAKEEQDLEEVQFFCFFFLYLFLFMWWLYLL